MRKFKKINAFMLVLTMLTMILASCGGPSTDNEEDVMTIKWQGIPYYAGADEDMYPEKLLEEKFNVEIEPIYYDKESYKTKRPLVMSQGDIPDIIYELDPTNIQSDAEQGFLAEIPYETIIKYAPSVVEMINKSAKEVWLYSYYNGKNYGVPNLYYAGKNGNVGKWRADWLEKLDISEVPSTIDEYHDALQKITYGDPDGNGKNDTYGMSGDMVAYNYCFSEIFGAYGVTPFNWMKKDGEYVYGGLLDETKEALKTLAAWYSEGLISPDFITDTTNSTIMEKFTNGKIGYMNAGVMLNASQLEVLKTTDANAKTVPATLPKGNNGQSGSFAWGLGGHVISFGKQIEEQPEKLQKILEMLEYMCTDSEFAVKLTIGEEGTHYKKASEEVGGVEMLAPYDSNNSRAQLMACYNYQSNSFYCLMPMNMELRMQFMNNDELESEKILSNANALTDAFMKPDVVPESSNYFEDLRLKQMVYFAKIIRGEKPVEYYEEFINEWNELGGKILTDNANEVAEIRDEIYNKVGAK